LAAKQNVHEELRIVLRDVFADLLRRAALWPGVLILLIVPLVNFIIILIVLLLVLRLAV
jgi:hypothetical protein